MPAHLLLACSACPDLLTCIFCLQPLALAHATTVVNHHLLHTSPAAAAEMSLNAGDVWGHFAPMFHLVDVFAIYAITLVSSRPANSVRLVQCQSRASLPCCHVENQHAMPLTWACPSACHAAQVGGRHVILPTFTPQDALLAIGAQLVAL